MDCCKRHCHFAGATRRYERTRKSPGDALGLPCRVLDYRDWDFFPGFSINRLWFSLSCGAWAPWLSHGCDCYRSHNAHIHTCSSGSADCWRYGSMATRISERRDPSLRGALPYFGRDQLRGHGSRFERQSSLRAVASCCEDTSTALDVVGFQYGRFFFLFNYR